METILLQDQYDQFPGFETCIALIRSTERDPNAIEQGYWWLESCAGQYAEQLISLTESELDPDILFLFVELLGDTKDPAVIPTLVSKLSHTDQIVRTQAVVSLENVGTEQAMALAQAHKAAHPDEWEA